MKNKKNYGNLIIPAEIGIIPGTYLHEKITATTGILSTIEELSDELQKHVKNGREDRIEQQQKDILISIEEIKKNKSTKFIDKKDNLPIEIRADEHIYIKNGKKPLYKKANNKAYYLLRGCIEISNNQGNKYVLIEDLFAYLQKIPATTKLRFGIPKRCDKYQYIRSTYNNIRRTQMRTIENYILLDIVGKEKINWITKEV